MNLKFLKLWYAAFALYGIGLIAFAISFVKSFENSVIFLFLFLVPATACYFVATKKLTFKEGYTLPQAISFYKKCSKLGIESKSTMVAQIEKVRTIAGAMGIRETSDERFLYTMFHRGEIYLRTKKLP